MHLKKEGTKKSIVGIKIILFLLMGLGIFLTMFSISQLDNNTSYLGTAISLISLLLIRIIIKNQDKKIRTNHVHIIKIKHKRKKLFNSRKLVLILFLILSLSSIVYLIKNQKNVILLIISTIILLISLYSLSISDNRKKESKETKNIKYKNEDIEHLQKIIKDKIKSLDQTKTPIDILYDILEERKKIKYKEISKMFNINIKKVDGWAKILEENELAIINYPAFGEPSLSIKETVEKTK